MIVQLLYHQPDVLLGELQPELFNNRDFGLPSRQHKKDSVFLMAVQASFPKELDFLSILRPDCPPRNAHSFYNP